MSAANQARLSGTSTDKDDRDFFTFTAAQAGTVTVTLASTAGPPARVEVENATGGNLLELEDGRTSGGFAVASGTVYFVRLRAPDEAAASDRVDLTLA